MKSTILTYKSPATGDLVRLVKADMTDGEWREASAMVARLDAPVWMSEEEVAPTGCGSPLDSHKMMGHNPAVPPTH